MGDAVIKAKAHPYQPFEEQQHERDWIRAVWAGPHFAAAFRRLYGLPRSIGELVARYGSRAG
jgi:hypothetical protein